jgi:hypothetical protein
MTLYFRDSSSWGKTTILPVIGTAAINTDGTLLTDAEGASGLVDNITIFDNDNLPESADEISSLEDVEQQSVNMNDYTHDDDVVFSIHDKEILKKSLNFFSEDQLVDIIEKAGLNKPKSDKKHVLIQFLYSKIDASFWKNILSKIFETFITE